MKYGIELIKDLEADIKNMQNALARRADRELGNR